MKLRHFIIHGCFDLETYESRFRKATGFTVCYLKQVFQPDLSNIHLVKQGHSTLCNAEFNTKNPRCFQEEQSYGI